MKFKISAETPCIKGLQHLFYFNNCQRRDYSIKVKYFNIFKITLFPQRKNGVVQITTPLKSLFCRAIQQFFFYFQYIRKNEWNTFSLQS